MNKKDTQAVSVQVSTLTASKLKAFESSLESFIKSATVHVDRLSDLLCDVYDSREDCAQIGKLYLPYTKGKNTYRIDCPTLASLVAQTGSTRSTTLWVCLGAGFDKSQVSRVVGAIFDGDVKEKKEVAPLTAAQMKVVKMLAALEVSASQYAAALKDLKAKAKK